MDSIIQLIISGVAMGFVYCLVGIETTLIWKATGILNFAHDKFITLGAFFFGGTMVRFFGANFLVSAICATIFMAIFGVVFSKIVINPLRNMPNRIFAMAGCIFLGFIIREALRLIYGPANFNVEGFFSGRLFIGNSVLPIVYVLIICVSVTLLVLQFLFFNFTKMGKAIRCVAEDKECAAIMGIDVQKNISISVAISTVICGWIGIMVIPVFTIGLNMANTIGMKGYCAGVIGGFGTYGGAIVGGLLLGVIENLYLKIGPAIYKDMVAFLLMAIFMVIKPTGLLGKGPQRGTVKKWISQNLLGGGKNERKK